MTMPTDLEVLIRTDPRVVRAQAALAAAQSLYQRREAVCAAETKAGTFHRFSNSDSARRDAHAAVDLARTNLDRVAAAARDLCAMRAS